MPIYNFIKAIPILYEPDYGNVIEPFEEDGYFAYLDLDFIPESWYPAAVLLGARPGVAVGEERLYLIPAERPARPEFAAIPLKLSEFGEQLEAELQRLAFKRYLTWKRLKELTWYHQGMSGARDGFAVYACEQNPDLRARLDVHQSMYGNYDDPRVTLQYHLASGIVLELDRFLTPLVEVLERRFLDWCALNVVL